MSDATRQPVAGESYHLHGTVHEWSRPSAATEPPSFGTGRKIYRLFVTVDAEDSSFLEIEDTRATSESGDARRLECQEHRSVCFTLDELEWLLEILPKARAALVEAQAHAEAEASEA